MQNDLATPLPGAAMLDDNFGDFGDNDMFAGRNDQFYFDLAENLAGDGFFGDEKPLGELGNVTPAAAPGEDEQLTMKDPESADSSFALNPIEDIKREIQV